MMGHAHATTAGAVALAVATTTPLSLGLVDMPAEQAIAFAVVTAGAGLLPDADHHSGTIAHSLPPVSRWVTSGVGRLSGGHRHATHSLLGVLVFTALAYLLSTLRLTLPASMPVGAGHTIQLGALLLVLVMVAFALKALRLTRGWVTSWLVSATAAGAAVWFAPEQLWWLPLAVAIGSLVHLLGDGLTVQGIPWFWPLVPKPALETPLWRRNGYFALPVLGTAGSWREWLLVLAVDVYVIWVLVLTLGLDTRLDALLA